MATVMTVKGQVTVPKAMRDKLGLRPGAAVVFRENATGEVVIAPAENEADRRQREATARVAALRAAMAHIRKDPIDFGMTSDEFMATLREPLP
jgi:AbrB family looped-hinge helix DNA binding protein